MESATDLNAPPTAPGCYGAPSVFSHDSDVCSICSAFADCSSACIQTLQALRTKINIEDVLARHRAAKAATIDRGQETVEAKPDFSKFLPSVKKPVEKVERKPTREPSTAEVPESVKAEVEGLKKNAKVLAATWIERGLVEHIRAELQQGRNPFAAQARHNHVTVVCDELLKGTVTKTSIKKAFLARCGNKKPWDETTAASHVGIALPAMVALGICVETTAGYCIAPVAG